MSLLPEITQKTIDIRNLLATNSAFKNPYQAVFGNVDAIIQSAKNVLNGAIPPTNATQILGAIQSLENTLGRFTSHTNALSGVNLTTGLSGANAATVMQVLATIDKYKDDGSACEFINEVFGSIIKFAQIANSINILITQIENFINNGDALLAQKIQFLTDLLEAQIQNDLLAFAEAQLRAAQFAVAQALTGLLNNECLSNIISIIGTNEVRQVLNRKIGEVTSNL